MQINKTKKSKRQPSNSLFDEDFSAGFEDSKLDKFKPAIKVFVGIVVLMVAIWGISAYFGSTDTKNVTNKNYTSDTVRQAEDISNETQDSEAIKTNLDSDTQRSGSSTSPNSTQQSSSNNSTPATKPYDPSKCEPLNSEAIRLRQVADQKKIAFDTYFDEYSKISFGDIYNEALKKYGHSAAMVEAERVSKEQKDKLDQLQKDWKDSLNKGNAAYGKYQECRAKL